MQMRILRWFWGVMVLLSCAWIGYGFVAANTAYSDTVENADTSSNSTAYQAGAALGATAGLGLFLCTGIPALAISGLLYWRNGVGIQRKREAEETERRHQEQLAVLKAQVGTKQDRT
jgi:hypothetical protein